MKLGGPSIVQEHQLVLEKTNFKSTHTTGKKENTQITNVSLSQIKDRTIESKSLNYIE